MNPRALAHVATLRDLHLLKPGMLVVTEALATLMPPDADYVEASNATIRKTLTARPDADLIPKCERSVRQNLGLLLATGYVTRDYDEFLHTAPLWRFPAMQDDTSPQGEALRRAILQLQKAQSTLMRNRAKLTHLRVVQQHEAMLRKQAQLQAQREDRTG